MAEVIVVGRFESDSYDTTGYPSSGPWTDTNIKVMEIWKGDPTVEKFVTVRQFGGPIPGGRFVTTDAKYRYSYDDPMVLFLRHSDCDGRWWPVRGDYDDRPWIIQGNRVFGEMSPGLGKEEFKRVVDNAIATTQAHWSFGDSLIPGMGRVIGRIALRGRMVLRESPWTTFGLVHIPKLHLAVKTRMNGQFELPWMRPGSYDAKVIPEFGKSEQVHLRVRAGQVDSVTVFLTYQPLRRE